MEVTLRRQGKDKKLYATPNHSWRVARNEGKTGRPATKEAVETKDLKAGQRLWDVFGYGVSRTPVSPAGVQHGLVFGDGNVPKQSHGFNTANLRLCGEKNTSLLGFFSLYPTRSIGEDVEVSGLPRRFKEFPSFRDDRSYLLGWLAGYFASDGCVSKEGAVTLSSASKENLEFVREVCYLLGICSYPVRHVDRISNLTGRDSRLYSVTFDRSTLTDSFFLCEEHLQRFRNNPPKRRPYWSVVSVSPTDRVEEVFCAVVPGTHEFVLEDNILTGNCLLLRAEDSREGWSNLLHDASMALMTGAGIGVQYSDIREEGCAIRRTGGVATGPLALIQMLNECGRGIMQGGSRRCLPEGTVVTMADLSKKNIEDVKVGDEVLTRFGPRKVLNVFDQGVQDLYSIETEHGSVRSTRRHRWLCSNTSRTKTFYVPVEKLSLSCKLYYHPSPVVGGDALDTDWAYVLGFYLGDGCAYSSGRTHEVTFQVDRPKHNHDRVRLITSTIENRFGVTPHVRRGHGECTEVRCRSKELVSVFQNYKRPNEPFSIPEEITNASLEARCAFIAGWFDADGCYSDSWKLSNKWPEVREQVMSFLAGLGFLSTENGDEVRLCNYQRPAWRKLVSPFSFKRPKGRSYARASSEIPSQILSISKVGEGRTFDIEVDDVHEFVADGFVSHNSAIWAGLRWSHPDILKFINAKNWSPEVRSLKEKDFTFPASLDQTNISVCLDDEFFEAYHNEKHPKHTHAHLVYWEAVARMLETGEPGFSVDCKSNSGEDLRNAPVSAETYVLLKTGYARVGDIVGEEVVVWTGRQWAETTFTKTAEDTPVVRVNMTGGKSIVCDPSHEFLVERWEGKGRKMRKLVSIERVAAQGLQRGDTLHTSLAISPGESLYNKDEWYALGYIYGDGSFHRRYPRAEVTFCRDDSKACFSRFPESILTSVNLNDSRGFIRAYTKNHPLLSRRSKSVFPADAYSAPPECRASFAAGLFDADGDWYSDQNRLRLSSVHREFLVGVRRLLESLGIRSVITKGGVSTYGKKLGWLLVVVTEDVETFRCYVPTIRVVPDKGVESYRPHRVKVTSVEDAGREDVYCCDVGVEEHSFQAEGVIISNCTEICSADDSDICVAKGHKVLTRGGYKPIEDITTGDEVASVVDGELSYQTPSAVVSNGVKPVLRVSLVDGRSVEVTSNHKILTGRGWVEAGSLTLTDIVSILPSYEGADVFSPDDEFLMLGWLVGGGWFTEKRGFGFVFGSDKDSFAERLVVDYMRRKYDVGYVQEQKNGVRCLFIDSKRTKNDFVRKYGIVPARATSKTIPKLVFSATKKQKASFLSGLFSAGGTAKTSRRNVVLSSSSREVLQDVQLLLGELGIYSWVGWYHVPGRNPQGVVSVNGRSLARFLSSVGFYFRKDQQSIAEEKLIPRVDSMGRNRPLIRNPAYIKVKSIEEAVEKEVFDISLPVNHHFVCEGMVVHNCNLGSINLARIETLDELRHVVRVGTRFLLAGSVYSDVPYHKVDVMRRKNRRLGLGLMGVHEWLLKRGKPYGIDDELGEWMAVYAEESRLAADQAAEEWKLSRPVKVRALAPTGTIGIVAETTTGIEPIFCVAFKRRYLKYKTWAYQYVVDPTAKRLIESGIRPTDIEDAYALARDPERRISFQAWMQQWIDHGISSTLNLPSWGSELNNQDLVKPFGTMLSKYLPNLRGMTVYPDGARGGQPLTPVRYETAVKHVGQEYVEEAVNVCDLTKGGSCGE